MYIFWFQGPSILTWETLPTSRICPNGLKLFLASLGMSRKNIQLGWFGRGNINDIETGIYLEDNPEDTYIGEHSGGQPGWYPTKDIPEDSFITEDMDPLGYSP